MRAPRYTPPSRTTRQDAIPTPSRPCGRLPSSMTRTRFLPAVVADLHRSLPARATPCRLHAKALRRLPNLKSLNQVANDQQGKANLGFALAFFRLSRNGRSRSRSNRITLCRREPSVPRRPLPGPVQQELGTVPGISHRPDRLRRQQPLLDAGADRGRLCDAG